MTPKEFVQKWLPDYDNKLDNELYKLKNKVYDNVIHYLSEEHKAKEEFSVRNFPEALESFAKEQRENCADAWKDEGDIYRQYPAILNAPMP